VAAQEEARRSAAKGDEAADIVEKQLKTMQGEKRKLALTAARAQAVVVASATKARRTLALQKSTD